MKLNRFVVSGFQSFVEPQQVALNDDITLLAGRNNVGKSALLRALQLLVSPQEGSTSGLRLTYAWSADANEIRLLFSGQQEPNQTLAAWLTGSGLSVARIEVDYAYTGGSGPTDPAQLVPAEVRLPDIHAKAIGTPGYQLGWDSGPFSESSVGVDTIQSLALAAAKRVVYLGPRRIEQGRRQLVGARELAADGRNLTDVLFRLQHNEPDRDEEVLRIMQSAFPDIGRIRVQLAEQDGSPTPFGEPVIYFAGRAEPVPLRLCGAGVEQILALTLGILGATEPQLFLIDEPQAYLHPHAERSLLGLLEQHPEHQYVVASHSSVLLRSRPITAVRLLHLEDGQTRVVDEPAGEQILSELGISAADLWLSDRLLWVEGPTEEPVLRAVADHHLSPADRTSLVIRRMPQAASRFATRRRGAAVAAYEFCQETTRAIAPLPVRMRFLFDADEKPPEFKASLVEASAGMARFLPVRELENLFLDVDLIVDRLISLADGLDEVEAPTREDVARRFEERVAAVDDTKLFPKGVSADSDPLAVIKGSALLSELWWEFVIAEYDKVIDGEALALAALAGHPELLTPLTEILDEFV